MKNRTRFYHLLLGAGLALQACESGPVFPKVHIVGDMKSVMWKGELFGKVSLDTLSEAGYYGMGPKAYLNGEIMLFDGHPYVSYITGPGSMQVEEQSFSQAPFFGYSKVKNWREMPLPDSIQDPISLENFLSTHFGTDKQFLFRLRGQVNKAAIHVVSLPEGSTPSSPEEAHQGRQEFEIHGQEVEILGFYSTQHQRIFTHHDSFLHMHLLTADKSMLGHIDDMQFSSAELTLLIPEN